MEYIESLVTAGISFVFLALIFIPMEKVFPAKPEQKIIRNQWVLDLCFFIGQYLFWSGFVYMILMYFSTFLNSIVSSKFRDMVAFQPIYLQALEVLILSDIIIYWGHRLQHKIDFLWRFHKVHHSTESLDWLAAHREHPIDSIYTIGLINLPAFIMGFNMSAIAMIIAFRGIWAIYIHSNVRLNIGILKMLIGSPDLHHWHHDLERDRGNYANISPLMDIIFQTYTCPDKEPDKVGIKEEFSRNYLGQLLEPFFSKNLWKKITNKTKETHSFPKFNNE